MVCTNNSIPSSAITAADGSGRTCGRRHRSRRVRLFSIRSSRGAVHGAPYIRAGAATSNAAPACITTGRLSLQVGARSGNRSGGRLPPVLFWENTNLEWMVLATRKRTPSVESIFRAGLRVRTLCAASAQRAAITPRRSPPPWS
jgi:hypothetical protein